MDLFQQAADGDANQASDVHDGAPRAHENTIGGHNLRRTPRLTFAPAPLPGPRPRSILSPSGMPAGPGASTRRILNLDNATDPIIPPPPANPPLPQPNVNDHVDLADYDSDDDPSDDGGSDIPPDTYDPETPAQPQAQQLRPLQGHLTHPPGISALGQAADSLYNIESFSLPAALRWQVDVGGHATKIKQFRMETL